MSETKYITMCVYVQYIINYQNTCPSNQMQPAHPISKYIWLKIHGPESRESKNSLRNIWSCFPKGKTAKYLKYSK